MIQKDTIQLYELIVALHEGDITDAQFVTLNEKLQDKASAREYVEFITIMSGLACPSEVDFYFDQAKFAELKDGEVQDRYIGLLRELAEEERSAPTIEIPKEEPQCELIQKVAYPSLERHKLSRFQKVFSVVSAAAILLIVVLLNVAPRTRPHIDVATLTDQTNVTWDQKNRTPYTDGRMVQGIYALTRGYASIRFDEGAQITVEAPAELSLNSTGDMELLSGRIYAIVPQQAEGFTVKAGSSKIVDLGTEFGVQAEVNGSAELHVIKGKVQFFAGPKGHAKTRQILTENKAVRYDSSTEVIKKIPFKKTSFVRRLPAPYELEVIETNPVAYWRVNSVKPYRFCSVLDEDIDLGKGIPGLSFVPGPPLGNNKAGMAFQINPTQSNQRLIPVKEGMDNTGYTYMMWIKPESIREQTLFTSMGWDPDEGKPIYRYIIMDEQGRIEHFGVGLNQRDDQVVSRKPLVAGQWFHVAVMRDGRSGEEVARQIYINGELASFSSGVGTRERKVRFHNQFCFGPLKASRDSDNAPPAFNGAIGEVCVYNRALRADEIRHLYESAQVNK